MNARFMSSMKLAAIAACTIPAMAIADQNQQLQFYGKVHLSMDVSSQDDPAVSNDGLSISTNSSRIGFKGTMPASGQTFLYQVEQEFRMDESGGGLATRNTYAGFKGDWGRLIAGFHDTPFKSFGSKWGLFSDTVADRRTILGASYTDHNALNERAQNAVMYTVAGSGLALNVMYAVDGDSSANNSVDNNDVTTASGSMTVTIGGFWSGIAVEKWEGHGNAGNVLARRAAFSYKLGMVRLGALYETIDSETNAQWNRDAYGVNAKIRLSRRNNIRLQFVSAEDAQNQAETGGDAYGVGFFHSLDKDKQLYLVYAATDNDLNANFQGVDGGHGDEVSTINGGSPNAFSAGFVVKF